MKIIIIFISKENSEPTLLELSAKEFISFDQDNDFRILHIIVVHSRFREVGEHNLKVSCSLHLDWCIAGLVETYGKDIFIENGQEGVESNVISKQYFREKLEHYIGLFNEGMLDIEDLKETLEELS